MKAGEIWCHEAYYLRQGCPQRKYIIILGDRSNNHNPLITRLTSRPNGLPSEPRCHNGNPRSGFFVGPIGGVLPLPTWVVFQDIDHLDDSEYALVKSGTIHPTELTLGTSLFCRLLRCVQQNDDITNRQYLHIGDTLEQLQCS